MNLVIKSSLAAALFVSAMACASTPATAPQAGSGGAVSRPPAETGDNAPYGTNIEGGQAAAPKN